VDVTPGGVYTLTLNDPDRRNAIGPELCAELTRAVAAIAEDRAARVLIVRGAGPAFCAGGNLGALLQSAQRPVSELRRDLAATYRSFLAIRELAIPSIAAVHGAAVGAGLNLAMTCDMRYLAPDAFLHANFAAIGIHPGGGASWFLTRALGRARALDLLLRARRIPAAEAVALGLANAVEDDPYRAALDLAQIVSSRDPDLVCDLRSVVNAADLESLEASVRFESWAQGASIQRSPHVLTGRPADRARLDSPT
jgi:enoyl-CoA hydratase